MSSGGIGAVRERDKKGVEGDITLVEADIDRELGIKAPSFDDTINEMNKIQRDIVWGAE